MLKIFKDHPQGTSILDDFDFYEEKANARRAEKRGNSESTYEARFSDDLKPLVCIVVFRSVNNKGRLLLPDLYNRTGCILQRMCSIA
jgi:hypothetical protein